MNYKIRLTDEDYLRFNVFYINHSKAGKRSKSMMRIAAPLFSAIIIMVFLIAGAEFGLIVTETIVLIVVSIIWCVSVPKLAEKSVRNNIRKIKSDGKLPYHVDSEIEFQDFMIVERSDQGEIRVNYNDIENIYLEKDYLYIFYSAIQAFIIPYQCLGEDKEQVIEYLMKKRS